ncbi:MAG TPA: hypothetical protein VGO53_16345 [Steroidobacteraceae bacterium]|jgi:hypothetical protein|nr:hypothetical protein [Steroidobacteraceae bacterium]
MRKHGRARRKVFPECGHRGWGKHCHRCAQATLFEAGVALRVDGRVVSVDAIKAEAARLRTGGVPVPWFVQHQHRVVEQSA